MKTLFLALMLGIAGQSVAGVAQEPNPKAPSPATGDIAVTEKEFVAGISGVDKSKIVEQFGEPSKRDDITNPDGKVIASVWHYHYLNTDEKGAYYKTTELDIVDDKVVMVVFMNHDGESSPAVSPEAPPARSTDSDI
ncbi:hypothetical protein [Methylovorus mays]|uniref:hypothetical protein n=1 Tax=Methylovorus mays TaxID=184077 RepID=UPI001E5ED47F|nr:hypothetical protein [Methylovorus mays]MCB5207639.1 hypothetical protein [Methylovorus mays]